jgi:hypothetical protein
MGKISSYPSDANVTTSDRLIGSDNENSNETKNFEIGDIIALAQSIITPPNTFVPYTGATANVDLGAYDIDADAATFSVVNTDDIYSSNLFAFGVNPNIFVGNDALQPVGLLIDTSTKTFSLGDIYSQFNGTKIAIEDGSSRITFVGGFNLSNGQGTAGQVLTSAGTGATPIWTTPPSLTGFVPYTGATTGVNLGAFSMTAANVNANNFVPIVGGSGNTFFGGAGGFNVAKNGVYAQGTDVTILGNSSSSGNGTKIEINDLNDSIIVGNNANANIEIDSSGINYISINNARFDIGSISGLLLSNGQGTAGQVLSSNGTGATPSWISLPNFSTFVPYTGATTGVNLGIYSMTAANVNANNFVPVVGGSGNTFFGGTGGYGVAYNGMYCTGINTGITILGNSTPGASTQIEIDAFNNSISLLNGYVSISNISGLLLNNGFGATGQVLISSGASFAPLWATVPELATNTFWKGSFYDSITQTLAAANTATPVILRSTDTPATNGISIVTDGTNLSRITFANAGTYNILFSAQLENSAITAQTVDFWLRKNGSTAAANIAHTNGKVQLQAATNHLMAAWNYFVTVAAGDYIQLVWSATSTNITIVAEAATALHPATPSVILTANLV